MRYERPQRDGAMSKWFMFLMLGPILLGTAWAFDLTSTRVFGLSPHEDTYTSMSMIKRRILRYAHEHNRLPNCISELPTVAGHRNKDTDWWGNPIQFEFDCNGIATLTSKGGCSWTWNAKEGMPMVLRFRTKDTHGKWVDEMVEFIEENR
jgi:hypothetical protein